MHQQNLLNDHDSGEEEEESGDKLGVEVVVLQTAASWRGVLPGQQPRVRRSAAGDHSQAGDIKTQLQWTPSVKLPAASVSKQAGQLRQATLVLMACLSWVIASSGAILVNKHIMIDLHFPYPGAVCALGLIGTSIVSFVAVKVLRLVPTTQPVSLRFFVTYIVPTGLFQALSMQLGNTAYLHLSVAFVQMLKAFTPVSTMVFAFLFKLERPTARLIGSVGLITVGVMAASYGEGNFSLAGVAAMITSMVCEGLRLVMMQALVSKRSFQPLEALMYLAPAASFWVMLIAGSTEVLHMHQDGHVVDIVRHPGYLLASAVAGFGVNAMAMAVISLASALTLKVLGICKDVGLVLFGVVMLGEQVTPTQLMGYGVSLLGLIWYNAIKAIGTGVAGGSAPAAGHGAAAAARGGGGRGSVGGAAMHHHTVEVGSKASARR